MTTWWKARITANDRFNARQSWHYLWRSKHTCLMKRKIFWGSLLVLVITSFSPDRAAESAATNSVYLAVPGSSWSLEIGAPGFTLQERNFSPDGTAARLSAHNKKRNLILSAFIEKAPRPGDAKECREYYWSKAKESPLKKDDVKMSDAGSAALVEYIVRENTGTEFIQKNINVYFAKDTYWIDVHLSKADFRADEEPILRSIVKEIRFNDKFVPSAIECAVWGSFFMSKAKYADAIRYNAKALELEKTNPTLSHRQQVFVLIDLINAYGNSGDVKKAREMSAWALTKEPGYPSFYYTLACSYAELGDKKQALENLRNALRNKAELFPGDQLPDPKSDPSFSKYSADQDFVKICDEPNK